MALLTSCYAALTAVTSIDSNLLGPNYIDNIAFAILAFSSSLIISREIGRTG